MIGKRKGQQHQHLNSVFALERAKAEQMKGRDEIMLQKRIKYWREVKSE